MVCKKEAREAINTPEIHRKIIELHKMQNAPKPPFWAWRKLCLPCPKLKNPTFGVFVIPPPGGLRRGLRVPLFYKR